MHLNQTTWIQSNHNSSMLCVWFYFIFYSQSKNSIFRFEFSFFFFVRYYYLICNCCAGACAVFPIDFNLVYFRVENLFFFFLLFIYVGYVRRLYMWILSNVRCLTLINNSVATHPNGFSKIKYNNNSSTISRYKIQLNRLAHAPFYGFFFF